MEQQSGCGRAEQQETTGDLKWSHGIMVSRGQLSCILFCTFNQGVLEKSCVFFGLNKSLWSQTLKMRKNKNNKCTGLQVAFCGEKFNLQN